MPKPDEPKRDEWEWLRPPLTWLIGLLLTSAVVGAIYWLVFHNLSNGWWGQRP